MLIKAAFKRNKTFVQMYCIYEYNRRNNRCFPFFLEHGHFLFEQHFQSRLHVDLRSVSFFLSLSLDIFYLCENEGRKSLETLIVKKIFFLNLSDKHGRKRLGFDTLVITGSNGNIQKLWKVKSNFCRVK